MDFNIVIGVWATFLVTRSYLFSFVRSQAERLPILSYFLGCPLCLGSWVGIALGYFTSNNVLLYGAVTGLSSYILVLITDVLQEVQLWLVTVVESLQRDHH